MVFKRKPKPRDDGIAGRAMDKVAKQSDHKTEATEAFDEGQAAEADGDEDAAIRAYLRSATAWQKVHDDTGYGVPPEPYARLGVLLRRHKELEKEVLVLESYMAHAGREPDMRLQERLQRAYELTGRFEE